MANETAPTIKWVRYDSENSSTSLEGNTVDYDAVQAGNYSNVICVRPQFDTTTNTTIGKVRFWWNDTDGKVTNDTTESSLPGNGWVMKYYVSYCNSAIGNNGVASLDNMLTLFNQNSTKNYLTASQILSTSSQNTDGYNIANYANYCRATWQSADDSNYVCMQPVPMFKNGFSNATVEEGEFSSIYGTDWESKIYTDISNKLTGKSSLYFSVGGDLNNSGKGCNIAEQVTTSSGFPYIFLTIKPPTNATAGVWSGFSCRMSFVWPWTTSSSINN